MRQRVLINSVLIVSGALGLSACDDEFESVKSKSKRHAVDAISVKSSVKQQKQVKEVDKAKAFESIENIDAKEYKPDTEAGFDNELSEDLIFDVGNQEKRIVLDFSINFEQIELKQMPKASEEWGLFRGLFESEGMASSIEMETHFEGPHIENKERVMTPDGAGVEFKVGF